MEPEHPARDDCQRCCGCPHWLSRCTAAAQTGVTGAAKWLDEKQGSRSEIQGWMALRGSMKCCAQWRGTPCMQSRPAKRITRARAAHCNSFRCSPIQKYDTRNCTGGRGRVPCSSWGNRSLLLPPQGLPAQTIYFTFLFHHSGRSQGGAAGLSAVPRSKISSGCGANLQPRRQARRRRYLCPHATASLSRTSRCSSSECSCARAGGSCG